MGHAHISSGCQCCLDMFAGWRESNGSPDAHSLDAGNECQRLTLEGLDDFLEPSQQQDQLASDDPPSQLINIWAQPIDLDDQGHIDCFTLDVVSLPQRVSILLALLHETEDKLYRANLQIAHLEQQIEERDRQICLGRPKKLSELWQNFLSWVLPLG